MNPKLNFFWLANKAFAGHSALTLGGLVWAWLVAQDLLAGVMVVLWGLAFIVWLEWCHGG
jgi:hypothetical protein